MTAPALLIPEPPRDQLRSDLDALRAMLAEEGGWLKSDAIQKRDARLHPRRVRELAEAAKGEILGCSAKGYRLTCQASPEEIRHALADLRSRARKLIARHVATAKAWHGAAGAARVES